MNDRQMSREVIRLVNLLDAEDRPSGAGRS